MTGGTKLSLLTKPLEFYKCKMVYSWDYPPHCCFKFYARLFKKL